MLINLLKRMGNLWCRCAGVLLICSMSFSATAADLDLGFGETMIVKAGNGNWYDRRFPYSENKPLGVSLGLKERLSSNLEWRLGYQYLGHYRLDAIGLSDDSNPARMSTSRFVSESTLQGFYLSARPSASVMGSTVFIELGALAFRPNFKVTMEDMPITFDLQNNPIGRETVVRYHHAHWQINKFASLGVSNIKRTMSLSIGYFDLRERDVTDEYLPAYKAAMNARMAVSF